MKVTFYDANSDVCGKILGFPLLQHLGTGMTYTIM